jgi:arylsulfatase A-like enzyme
MLNATLRIGGLIAIAFSCLLPGRSFAEKKPPNILWLTSEDNNVDWVGCYGNPHADTPNIDKLATEGFQYMHCYANAPVCAPSRCTWITGIHAVSMGTHPMRSRYDIPHDRIPYYPDLLKKAGYYTSNVKKTDYNIGGRGDNDCWDSMDLDWEKLKTKQPFFQVINSTLSHESKAFGDVNHTTHSPEDVRLAKYHPDIPGIRNNYAHYHDAVKRMDDAIGKSLAALEASGMADNTIVVYNSDHGGVLPRSKRFLYNSGTHCPLVIRIPEAYKDLWPAEKPGSKIDRLVSYIDMPKTWMAITGADHYDHMQGLVFLGPKTEPERPYHFSWRGRMDERPDNTRAIRNKQFVYIKNYMPYLPNGQKLDYMWKMEATKAWEAHYKAGKTDAVTGRFFEPKDPEELYHSQRDPDNITNLIKEPELAAVAQELRKALRDKQLTFYDSGLLPEPEIVHMAQSHNLTIYDFVRNKELYPLERYLDAADVALAESTDNLKALVKMCGDNDPGIRYWGTVGLFMLKDQASSHKELLKKLCEDDAHVTRLMAAWALYRLGDKDQGIRTINELIKEDTYALEYTMNVIDWIGAGAEPYRASIENNKRITGKYGNRLKGLFDL